MSSSCSLSALLLSLQDMLLELLHQLVEGVEAVMSSAKESWQQLHEKKVSYQFFAMQYAILDYWNLKLYDLVSNFPRAHYNYCI